MSWGWNERATKADVKHLIGGDEPKVVYKVGQYEVTVPGKEQQITYCVPHQRSHDPRETFPNLEVRDGELRLPVTDLVDTILSRIEPVELARALWQNDEVKAEFMSCLTTRYNESGVGDEDRRKFIAEVKEAIHDKALDTLASTMAKLEWEMDRRANHYHEINRINDVLRDHDVKVNRSRKNEAGEWVMEPVLLQFDQLDRSTKNEDSGFTHGELEVGGKGWEEARSFWRAEVAKRFPAPADDDDGSSDLGISDADLEVPA